MTTTDNSERSGSPADGASAPGGRVVFVTGPSGAGRSTAINVLEDLGFEVIDNLPLSFLPRLLSGPLDHPLALGIDVRNRDFSVAAMVEAIDLLTRDPALQAEVLYLDARPEVIVRRYSETRRRHPAAPEDAPSIGVDREIEMLASVRNRADVLIDTSDLTPHDLRDEITRWYAPKDDRRMAVSVQSFSYKRGLPRGIDMVFDVRFLRNPHWEAALRPLDGRDPRVAAFVAEDPRLQPFFTAVRDLVLSLLPAYRDEGKSHLAIGFGCTGGQHRSVALAEMLAEALAEAGWGVSIRHRELERRTGASAPGEAG
ncbi:RNase adapter RapZ [Palleronia sp. KMU-117]|uniref:RNase adapter RapZ n=1 Tax=Palleronia sp. KMU-117 TaxID=3434108 RepID=UPI003D75126C